MIKSKEEMMDEFYQERVEWLNEIAPLTEEILFPSPNDGFEMFCYDLDIARLEKIKIKGVRKILEKHNIISDIDEIKKELYKHYTNLNAFIGDFDKNDDDDQKWLNVINNQMYDEYGVRYTDYDTLVIQTNNVRKESYERRHIVTKMASICYKKKEEWKEVLDFDPTYEVKNGWLYARGE